jgi:hypothetical protein
VVKVFLRSRETGLYYGGDGMWVASPHCAFDYGMFEGASHACRSMGMQNMEVVLRTEQPLCELKVPLCEDW